MKRVSTVILLVFVGSIVVSCLPKASEEECRQMCENLVNLRGENNLVTVSDAISVVEKDYVMKEQSLKERMEQEITAWDNEMNDKITGVEKETDKAEIKKEYKKKKAEVKKRYKPQIEKLGPSKKEAINEAKEKAAASENEVKIAVDQCAEKAVKEGTTQKVAQCRINATTSDKYWNGCR